MISFDPSIFKAYDVRGTYPDQINTEIGYELGHAIATYLKAKRIVIGHDMRKSSAEMSEAMIRGLLDQGCDVVDAGLIATPHIIYAINAGEFDGGIVLTASHNPGSYCGIKLHRERGVPISLETGFGEIKEMLTKERWATPDKKGALTTQDFFPQYLEFITAGVQVKPLKVVVDAGNGMEGMFMPAIAERLGLELVPMYFELDGSFPNHEADPLKLENVADLQKRVIAESAEIGFAYDGDGDRLGTIDELGGYVPGDMVTALIARSMLREYPEANVVYDLRSSHATREIISEAGGVPVECRVGHSIIKQKMRDVDAIFGGELSSHFYWRDYFYADNADLALIKLLQLMSDSNQPLSKLVAGVRRYWHSGEINSKVSSVKDKLEELEALYGKYEGKNAKISHLDGITIDLGDWWFNVRPSNTEPVLRLNLESLVSDSDMQAKRDEVLGVIRR